MKAVKIILNIFGIILASILSIVLFAMLVATPFVSTATNLITPNTLNKVIADIDVETLLENSMGEESESAIPGELIAQVIKSDIGKDIISLYSEEVSAAFKGKTTNGISADDLKQIFSDNIDEITDIMYQYVPEGEQITKEELKSTLAQELDVLSEDIADQLPDVSQLMTEQEDNELMQTASLIFSGTILRICIFVVIVLSALIYALRFPRFKGFMWLGSVYFLAAIFTLIVGFAGSSVTSISTIVLDVIPAELFDVVTPIISLLFTKITNGGLVLLLIAVLLITAFILCRIFIVKKKKAKLLAEITEQPLESAI